MERLLPSEPLEDLSITAPGTNGALDPLPEREPLDSSNYWQNPDGSIRKEILEKVDQISRGQY